MFSLALFFVDRAAETDRKMIWRREALTCSVGPHVCVEQGVATSCIACMVSAPAGGANALPVSSLLNRRR